MKRINTPNAFRFLTFSCHKRLPLFNNDAIKQVFVEHLQKARQQHRVTLTAWVLMPEHVHLLLRPENETHSPTPLLKTLKSGVGQQVLKRWRALEAPVLTKLVGKETKTLFWQPGGGHDRAIVSAAEYVEKFEYIHNNPVSRGLVSSPMDWPWSSAQWHGNMQTHATVPMDAFNHR